MAENKWNHRWETIINKTKLLTHPLDPAPQWMRSAALAFCTQANARRFKVGHGAVRGAGRY